MTPAHKIIVVDPDKMIIDLLKYNLESEGYGVENYPTAEAVLESDVTSTDLVITEVVLGDINGLMLTGMLKGSDTTSHIPVMICSTRDSEDDIIKGFDAGCDDYILKPFSLREFLARIRSVLRRAQMRPHKTAATSMPVTTNQAIAFGTLTVDPGSRSVTLNGEQVSLTRTEMQLLHTLMAKPGHFFTHSDLYSLVWQKQPDGSSRALDVSISRLRKKLGEYGSNIVSRSGIGYGFVEK